MLASRSWSVPFRRTTRIGGYIPAFREPEDYETLKSDMRLLLSEVRQHLEGGAVEIPVQAGNREIVASLELSPIQHPEAQKKGLRA